MVRTAACMCVLVAMVAVCLLADVAAGQTGAPASKPGAACTLCNDGGTIVCPGCAGKTRSVVECALCKGVGKGVCWWCVGANKHMPPGQAKLKKGYLPCLNHYCDGNGLMRWENGDKDACHFCDGHGSFKCPMCTAGVTNCYWCGGRGRADATCPDCGGRGRLPCPGCVVKASEPTCAWCRGAHAQWCHLCEAGRDGAAGGRHKDAGAPRADYSARVKCASCAGTGLDPCPDCDGIGRTPCAECGCSGYIRSKMANDGTRAGRKTHEVCKGTGWTACEKCKNGRVPCGKCDKGSVPVKCSGCSDHAGIVCRGCSPGPWQASETYGRFLHAAGRFDQATAFFQAADMAAGAMKTEPLVTTELTAGKIMEIVKATRKRLEASLKATAEKKPLPPPPKILF